MPANPIRIVARLGAAAALALAATLPAPAATRAEADRLFDAVGLPGMLEIMHDEGVDYGLDLEADLFPGQGGAAWRRLVEGIYDTDAMRGVVSDRFAALLADTDVTPLLAFFDGDLGRRIVRLELEARRAMLDEDLEAAAYEALDMQRDEGDPRLDLLDDFVAANDLVEDNVAGALNASYAFYAALVEGGGGEAVDEGQILSDVWAQEPEIRADTLDWVYAFLSLAYRPLSDDELRRYTELSRSEAGRDLNRALFGAFDRMYVGLSRTLGLAAARFLSQGQDL